MFRRDLREMFSVARKRKQQVSPLPDLNSVELSRASSSRDDIQEGKKRAPRAEAGCLQRRDEALLKEAGQEQKFQVFCRLLKNSPHGKASASRKRSETVCAEGEIM